MWPIDPVGFQDELESESIEIRMKQREVIGVESIWRDETKLNNLIVISEWMSYVYLRGFGRTTQIIQTALV